MKGDENPFAGLRPIKDAVEIELGEIPLARAVSIFSRKFFMSGIRRELKDRAMNPKKSDRGKVKARYAAARARRMARNKATK